MRTVEIVRGIIEPMVVELGYSLYEVEFVKQQEGYVLTVYIDSSNGITLDDCEKVSRAIDPLLDEKDPIYESYYLSVSSIGIDRPIKSDKDFERSIGKRVDVKLYAPIDKKKAFIGILKAFDTENFTVELDDLSSISIARKSAANVCPHIDFE